MADEIEALAERVEAENATLEAKLAARESERARAEADAREEVERLKRRLATLEPELAFTTEYGELLETQTLKPSPRRVRLQGLQLLVRYALCGVAGAAAGFLSLAGLEGADLAAALVLPGAAIWVLGDLCDALEVRHG